MATSIAELSKTTANTAQQLSNNPDTIPFLIMEYFENVGIEEGSVLIYTRDVSEDGAWGKGFSNSAGTSNTLYWGATGALWQNSYTNSMVLSEIRNPSGVFREHFIDEEFIDTTTSTATISLGTSGSVSFTDGQILQSNVVHKEGSLISRATLNINSKNITGTLNWYLSANGGTNWELVTLGKEHTFTNTGTELKYKAVSTGSSTISTAYTTNNYVLNIRL